MRSFNLITPIILAAGDSMRMGYPKALLPIGNETFLTRIVGIARKIGLAEPVIVLGRTAETIAPTIRHLRAQVLINPDPDRGQLSSIQLGLLSLDVNSQACMIWPVDQPAVSEALVRDLAQLFVQSDCLLAFPQFSKKRGHPAILHSSLFPEFLEARLEEGPKKIILRHLQDIAELPTDEFAAVHDVDTPADYEALTGETLQAVLTRQETVNLERCTLER